MGDNTGIEWADATWNPITGCSRVSPGCDHCYMFAQYPRLRAMGARGYELAPDEVQVLAARFDQPMRWTRPRRIFVNSMSDTFHKAVDWVAVTELFRVMRDAPHHQFLVLTKRPGRAAYWWSLFGQALFGGEWPAHIWLGTSVELQKYAPRIDVLARVPAPIRFLSAEPLLGALDITEYLERGDLQWVIAGGESGAAARPMDLEWARQLRDQCAAADVPYFLKQLGGRGDKRGGDKAVLDGLAYAAMPA